MQQKQSLAGLISEQIARHGPMSVEEYWELCLFHPEHGYYIKKDPLGRAGDFTTAPEISQLFGEMIGIWAAEEWHRLGKPAKLHIVECGPGRGTLMADFLKIAGMVEGFAASLNLHLIEVSPHLRAKQRATLSFWEKGITWHDSPETIPSDAPVIFIGNEFLDALPIRQYIRVGSDWCERLIGFEDKFLFLKGKICDDASLPDAGSGEIFEVSPAREAVVNDMALRLKAQRGVILMIDYGHFGSGTGDTFQAVRDHKFSNVLENQGDSDLTSHIDFTRLASNILNQGISTTLSTQKDFLERMGIFLRAEQLKKTATPEQAQDIDSALERLTGESQMGNLFKVMEVRV